MNYYPPGNYILNIHIYSRLESFGKTEMKRMKTSEKSRTLLSRLFHLFIFCAITYLFASCGYKKPMSADSEYSITKCWSFHRELKKIKTCSIKELCNKVNEWEAISEKTYLNIMKDEHSGNEQYSLLNTSNDSIRSEIVRLAISETRTLRDLTLFKISLSPVVSDSTVDSIKTEAVSFFSSLDSFDVVRNESSEEMLLLYRNYLSTVLMDSICNNRQLFEFLRDEDILFRRFLVHLSEFNGGADQITELTSVICTHVYRQAYNGSLDEKNVLVYMALRTNRRLILNAERCVRDIASGMISDKDMAQVYIWMILQPFISMDSFCMSMLSERDRKRLLELADAYVRCIGILSGQRLLDASDYLELPDRILRLYLVKQ